MNNINSNALSTLDQIRINNGKNELKKYYIDTYEKDAAKAVNLINEDSLHFASLFMLMPQIQSFKLYNQLNTRNKLALKIIVEILMKEQKPSENMTNLFNNNSPDLYASLKWILETGCKDDGLSNEYDEILDSIAALLTTIYKDKTILHIIVEMIFERHNKGFLIHDLVWAFFQCCDPHSLTLIANHLPSTVEKEYELACKLLNFIPFLNEEKIVNKQNQYYHSIKWIEENHLFLYSTGQNMHKNSNPKHFQLALDAKYLCKAVSFLTGETFMPFTKKENMLLEDFNKLDENNKLLLSNFSLMLHRQNIYNWNIWLNYPITEKINIAKNYLGGD